MNTIAISKLFKDNPDQTVLNFDLFASHGMIKEGR